MVRAAAACVLAVLALGCAGLPEAGGPQGRMLAPEEAAAADRIPYRRLRPADFGAPQPPAAWRAHADRVGAVTCADLGTRPGTGIRVVEERSGGAMRFRAVPVLPGFRAWFVRNCSWWNPELPPARHDYVLEHEQIHLALFEVEARRLDLRAREIARAARAVAESPELARAAAEERLAAEIRAALGRALERSLRFDRETSGRLAPAAQERWWRKVTAELEALAPGTEAPPQP